MVGAVLIVIAMVLVIPVAVMFGGAVWSAVLGWTFDRTEPAPAPAESSDE